MNEDGNQLADSGPVSAPAAPPPGGSSSGDLGAARSALRAIDDRLASGDYGADDAAPERHDRQPVEQIRDLDRPDYSADPSDPRARLQPEVPKELLREEPSEAPPPEIQPPRSWDKDARERFAQLPREAQEIITLKALTYEPTGGIVAAPTANLPETLGGIRNWDYRFCWLRDATLSLLALMNAGYYEEAGAWRDWLLRAVAHESSFPKR